MELACKHIAAFNRSMNMCSILRSCCHNSLICCLKIIRMYKIHIWITFKSLKKSRFRLNIKRIPSHMRNLKPIAIRNAKNLPLQNAKAFYLRRLVASLK